MKKVILALALLFTGCTWDKAAVIDDEEIIQEITKEVMELKPVKAKKDGSENKKITDGNQAVNEKRVLPAQGRQEK